MGKVDFGGVLKSACLEHVPDARPGDYLIVHVGFALSQIDETEARRIFEFLKELPE
jgi:hydrogenase expression/formation protein HypC